MIRRWFGWEREAAAEALAPLALDVNSRRMLDEFVRTIVDELGFWAAMMAVVETVNGEERLTVKTFATRFDRDAERLFGVGAVFGDTLLEAGEQLTGQRLIDNYVVINDQNAQVNKAVAIIRGEQPYAIVDDLYDVFAPQITPELARRLQMLARVKKIITMPFRSSSGRVIGNLYAAREKEDVSDELLKQLRVCARMATTVIDNMLLRHHTTRVSQREDVLKETITQLLSVTLSEQRVLENIVNSVVHKLGFRASMLAVVRQHEGKRILPVVAYQFADGLTELLAIGEKVAGMRMRGAWVYVDEETAKLNIGVRAILEGLPEGRTRRLSDLFSPVIAPGMANALQTMFGLRSLATVPLRDKSGELRGNLYAGTERETLTDAEIEDLKTLALAASIAIENAQHVRETQRMGLLASSVGHEMHRLNGLLGGARWDTQMLAEEVGTGGDKDIAARLHDIHDQIADSVKLFEGLNHRVSGWDHAREDAVIDVNSEIRAALERLPADYGYKRPAGIDLRERYSREKPFVLATGELREVFAILIKNACEALEKGGRLEISTEIVTSEKDQYERDVWVKISDSGAGIPLAARDTLFKLKPSAKAGGMGYGLWSARLTVEWFGGNITFETCTAEEIASTSRLKGRQPGTTFHIKLPLIDIKDDDDRLQ